MSRVVCPGSFDPIHNGHVDIITRASGLFDEVLVAVSKNPAKTYRFDLDQRLALCEDSLSHLGNAFVLPMGPGLLADFCRQHGATALVKGLRSGQDLEYELPMSAMNRHLAGVDTVFLPSAAPSAHLSSSLLKEVATLGGDIRPFVPPSVFEVLTTAPRSSGSEAASASTSESRSDNSSADGRPAAGSDVLGGEEASG